MEIPVAVCSNFGVNDPIGVGTDCRVLCPLRVVGARILADFSPEKVARSFKQHDPFTTPDVVLWQNASVIFKRNPVNAKSDIKESFKMQAFNRMWWV